jgi:hypothetical protein
MKTLNEVLDVVIFLAVVLLVCLAIGGCQQQGTKEVKASIRECLIVGHEIEKMERAKGNTDTADKIDFYVKEAQKIVDANDIKSKCPRLQALAELGYQWVEDKYPQTLYPVMLALLKERLWFYCNNEVVQ